MRDYKEISRTKPSLDPSGNNTPLGCTKSSIFVRNLGRFCILGCTGAFLATWEILHFGLQWRILDNLWGFAFLVVMVRTFLATCYGTLASKLSARIAVWGAHISNALCHHHLLQKFRLHIPLEQSLEKLQRSIVVWKHGDMCIYWSKMCHRNNWWQGSDKVI